MTRSERCAMRSAGAWSSPALAARLRGMRPAVGPEQEQAAATAPAAAVVRRGPAPAIPTNPLKEAYFGEQHLHTAYSLDAYIGGARLTPVRRLSLRQGRGGRGRRPKVRLHAPLDWAAVTDHAEYLGEMYSTHERGCARATTTRSSKSCGGSRPSRSARSGSSSTCQEQPRHDAPARAVLRRPRDHGERLEGRIWPPPRSTTSRGCSRPSRPSSGARRPRGATSTATSSSGTSNVPERPMSYVDINREEGLWAWMAGLEKQGMKAHRHPAQLQRAARA